MNNKIFITGPYSESDDDCKQNFLHWKKALESDGWIVKSRLDVEKNLQSASWRRQISTFMVQQIHECDSIFLLKDWQSSAVAQKSLEIFMGHYCYCSGNIYFAENRLPPVLSNERS